MKGRLQIAALAFFSLFFSLGIIGTTYYDILGLKKGATATAISSACKAKKSVATKNVASANRTFSAEKAKAKAKGKELEKELETKYQRKVAEARSQEIVVENACVILEDAKKRTAYDALDPKKQAKEVSTQKEMQKPAETDTEGVALDSIEKKKAFIQKHISNNTEFKLSEVLGDFSDILSIPGAAAAFYSKDWIVRNMKFVEAPKSRKQLGFSGTLVIGGTSVEGTIYFMLDKNYKLQYSVIIDLPHGKKLSDIFSFFAPLNKLSLPEPKLIASTYAYREPGTQYDIKRGLTFNSSLALTGPLTLINDLKNKAKDLDSIIVRADPVRFYGFIPMDIKKAEFGAIIPLRLGIDFTKIPKLPSAFTKVFKELTTDDFVFKMSLSPEVKLGIEAGIRLVLGTQTDPIRLSAFGALDPNLLTLGMRMRNMLDLGIISVGEAGLQIDIDRNVVDISIAFGIPITGFGFNGRIGVGKGRSRAVFDVAGALSIKSTGLPDFVIDVNAANIQFAAIVELVLEMAHKAGFKEIHFPSDKMPEATIELAEGYLALEDVTIAGKEYKAGFALQLEMNLLGKRFGFSIDIQHKELKGTGYGYLPPIDIKAGGKTVFLLSGPGIDTAGFTTEDRGASVQCTIDAKKPFKSSFKLGAVLEVPAIGLRQVVKFLLSKTRFRAYFETKFVGFTVRFNAKINPTRPDDFYMNFSFKDDFNKFISQKARPAIDALKRKSEAKLLAVDKKIREASDTINKAKRSGVSKTDKEIAKTKAKIKKSKDRINQLKRKCKKAKWYKKTFVCAKVGGQIIAEGTKLAAYETYLHALLKPGKEVIKGTVGLVAKATKELADAHVLKNTVQGILTGISRTLGFLARGESIFKVVEASGEFDTQDILHAKAPRLILLRVEINIPTIPKKTITLRNLQFDFKNPIHSAEQIAKELVKGIKF